MTLFKKDNSNNNNSLPKQFDNTITSKNKKIIPNGLRQPTLISCAQNLNHHHQNFNHNSNNSSNNYPKDKKDQGGGGRRLFNGNAKPPKQTKIKQDVKMYHWQSEGSKKSSVDDMVLLTKISESAITENLKKRLMEDKIYTYIGPVLVAVNPFKHMPYFTEKEISMYQGAAHYEVPPHIYALADNMYRNMLIDNESQCVIISGESGAGKTVSAKFIMNYITRISGGGAQVQMVKDIILESNPLLEAFGNAKTIRNNNSSRFGKYIEIEFSRGGEPQGGRVSNFLLEKSRVHFLNEGERNFHIFYQLCSTTDENCRSQLGITSPDYYNYLSQSGVYDVEGTDDTQDLAETLKAMKVMGIDESTQMDILKVVAAILHMGNITFREDGNKGVIQDLNYLEYPAFLLGITPEALNQKLTSRVFDSKWGSVSERVDVILNMEQAQFARDAWAKGLYSRVFDYIVQTVNIAMKTSSQDINLGILDIYGFEIFGRNGFEQFCINYVNEKLQQIFIELTLKNEQEEYKQEGIQWKPIEFFNNKIVCDLIESKRPPGIFSVLDDTVATMSAVSDGADIDFRNKMTAQVGSNPHYQTFRDGFTIKHYAGKVDYHIDGFCEKNRDVLFVDIIEVMKSSSNSFVKSLFPDNVSSSVKSRPTTAAAKIKTQANNLVTTLSACVPHYIRCIKPNETKKPKDWNDNMVKDQVEYLGLKENIKVKRAGFAYRRPFEKFIRRYSILVKEDMGHLLSDPKRAIHLIMGTVNMDSTQYQLGISKCFIKDPESLYMLEEYRERRFNHYARIIQKAFKKYFSKQIFMKEKIEACDVLLNRKRRRENSVNRNFYGDYVGVELKPNIRKLIPRREKVEFAETVMKYNRRFKACKRDLILTKNAIYFIGLVKIKKGPQKGELVEVVKKKVDLQDVSQVTLSTFADNFVLFHVKNDFELLLEINFKTEFIMLLNRKLKESLNKELPRNFIDSFDYNVKKTIFSRAGTRQVRFSEGTTNKATLTTSGTTLNVKIKSHLPAGTRCCDRKITPEVRMMSQKFNNNNTNSRKQSKSSLQHHPISSPYLQQLNDQGPSSNFPKQNTQKSNARPVLSLPKANQRWPPGNQTSHVVPPPPNQPAPADQPAVPRKPPTLKPKPKLNQVRAVYSYDAKDYDEITFVEGDILEVVKEDESGWWTCRYKNKEGFCPGNYFERI